DRWHEAADANQRAIELWRQACDRLREGDTMRRYTATLWRLCRGAESDAMGRSAYEVLEPLGPSRELARACLNLSGPTWMAGDREGAMALMRRGREMARSLGDMESVVDSLIAEGCLIAEDGGAWRPLLLEALDFCLANNLPAKA